MLTLITLHGKQSYNIEKTKNETKEKKQLKEVFFYEKAALSSAT